MDEPSDDDLDAELAAWPKCATPDCEHKMNLWAGLPFCSPCTERRIGAVELERRYAATHDASGQWSGEPYA